MSRGCQEAPSFLPRVTPTIYTFRLQTAFLAIFYSLKLSFLYLQTDLFAIIIPSNCLFLCSFWHHLYLWTPYFCFATIYTFFWTSFIPSNTFKLPFLANIFYTFLVIIDLINITLPSKRFLTFKSLATIYTFEENKSKKCLAFKLQKNTKSG